MQVIKTEIDGKLVIGIVFEDQDDIESIRALFGGCDWQTCIRSSNTPRAPAGPVVTLIPSITRLLNPLSKLLNE